MQNFDSFVTNLLGNPSQQTKLTINGMTKLLKGMARFRTINMGEIEYIKIVFTDMSFLLVLPQDKELYYSDEYIVDVQEVTDEMIGNEKHITVKGKEYELGNANDYQYVKQLYVGTIDDIEGEVRFSDYFPTNGEKEFLSLGWIVKTGKRADVNPKLISNESVDLETSS